MAIRARRTISASLIAAAASPAAALAAGPSPPIALEPIGSYRERAPQGPENACRRSIAEIAAYDPLTRRLFVTNAADRALDILDIGDPTRPRLVRRVGLGAHGLPTSVAASWGLVAVAVETVEPNETDPGERTAAGCRWPRAAGARGRRRARHGHLHAGPAPPAGRLFGVEDPDPADRLVFPTCDAGYYVFLPPLPPGEHTLHWTASTANGIEQDVTYHLTVVPGGG
jgi:hypothetical protein